MQWSRYNLLFESKNNGWLLYNSGSNSFLQMDYDAVKFIRAIAQNPNMDFTHRPSLFLKLRLGGFLVEDGKDDDLFRILKMRRLTTAYAGNHLMLTIALTKACTFDCIYCFERDRTPSQITDKTEENIIRFIKKHKAISSIGITWYGGEPLLEFERMKSLSRKIEELGKDYKASIYTNGYLLTPEIIGSLNELKVGGMLISIDGSKETHDKRRFLIGGGSTYDKIIENIDNLMRSDWKGHLNLRVNVDKSNGLEFVNVYRFIEKKYPELFNKRIVVFPSFVTDVHLDLDVNCYNDSDSIGEFLLDLVREHDIDALGIFPSIALKGCTLIKRNAYVVGPNGELYKCTIDLGDYGDGELVGNIDDMTNWNMSFVAEGMVGASYLNDTQCEKCFFFPICDGGCPKIRFYNNRDNGNRDTCTHLKKHIKEFLEFHYERKIKAIK